MQEINQDINEDTREKISALLDGELNDFETRQLLRQLDQLDPEKRDEVYAYWQRMQLYSDALDSQRTVDDLAVFQQDAELVSRVAEFIDIEVDDHGPELDAADERPHSADVKYLADKPSRAGDSSSDDRSADQAATAPTWSRLAVAASVALAVIVGFQQVQLSEQTELLAERGAQVQGETSAPLATEGDDAEQAVLLAEIESASSEQEQLIAQRRLIEYLRSRQQAAPLTGGAAAQVATFEESVSAEGAEAER